MSAEQKIDEVPPAEAADAAEAADDGAAPVLDEVCAMRMRSTAYF